MNIKNLDKIFERAQEFKGDSLTGKISLIENQYIEKTLSEIIELNTNLKVDQQLLESAFEIKKLASQINVLIHSTGILYILPQILEEGENIKCLSLGAGNAGCEFDLVTDIRVAEFKFIQWKEKGNSIRIKTTFKDFYKLAEHSTKKKKELYLIEPSKFLLFLNGNRAFSNIFSGNKRLWDDFVEKYENRFEVISQYYQYKKNDVEIIDLARLDDQFKSQVITKNKKREKKMTRRNSYKKGSSANQVRQYVIDKHIKPARESGLPTVRVSANEIHKSLGYKRRFPTVCQALDTDIFIEQANVKLVKREGPVKSSTVEWVFEV